MSTMIEADVLSLIELFEANALDVVIDGGWGVDALLGRQTRAHEDLDIALPEVQVPTLRRALAERGYAEVWSGDQWECNFVLQDGTGRRVDVHSYTLDAEGANLSGVAYEGRHLTGRGMIGGHTVRCIPPPVVLEFHAGYELDENDYNDVRQVCEAFDLTLPNAFRRFT